MSRDPNRQYPNRPATYQEILDHLLETCCDGCWDENRQRCNRSLCLCHNPPPKNGVYPLHSKAAEAMRIVEGEL